jgi:hypothetical protein
MAECFRNLAMSELIAKWQQEAIDKANDDA